MIYNSVLSGISTPHLDKLSGTTMEPGGLLRLSGGGQADCSFMVKFTCKKSKSTDTVEHFNGMAKTFNKLFGTKILYMDTRHAEKDTAYNNYIEKAMWIIVHKVDEGTIQDICNRMIVSG